MISRNIFRFFIFSFCWLLSVSTFCEGGIDFSLHRDAVESSVHVFSGFGGINNRDMLLRNSVDFGEFHLAQIEERQQYTTSDTVKNESRHIRNSLYFEKDDGKFIRGSQVMTKREFIQYMQLNCPQAWKSYQKGKKLWWQGWVLFGVGASSIVGGVYLYTLSVDKWFDKWFDNHTDIGFDHKSKIKDVFRYSGIGFISIGGILVSSSVPCLIVGGIKKYNPHRAFNENCPNTARASIDFGIQVSQNGLGLAVIF